MTNDDWVTVATSDNSLVAEMLLRLRQPNLPPPETVKLEWTVRQRRSKSAPKKNNIEGADSTARASPSTPLSWSDGTSLTSSAAGADGVEHSTTLQQDKTRRTENVRSNKAAVANELSKTKRLKHRKTLVQLREEESLLLNERRDLTNKLTTFYRNVEVLKGTNENLKRMKLNLPSQATTGKLDTNSVASEETISDQLLQLDTDQDEACSNSGTSSACKNSDRSLPFESSMVEKLSCKKPSFVLPDLNLPCEDGP
ncbi:hypothetical protein ACFE04_031540 [Oxalis oulophora]